MIHFPLHFTGAIVKLLVHKNLCTTGIPLWARHVEGNAITERFHNGIPVMHTMATMLKQCITLQAALAKHDPDFHANSQVRDRIIASSGKVTTPAGPPLRACFLRSHSHFFRIFLKSSPRHDPP